MNPVKLLRTALLRTVEARLLPAADPPLMERAGAVAARVAAGMLPPGGVPLIVAGPGNNGGDALVAARLLKEQGVAPTVVLAGDPARLPADARGAYEEWLSIGGKVMHAIPPRSYALVVDGLFGIGLARPLAGEMAALVEQINTQACPVLALDIPSGLDADSGRILGAAVRATRTLTFIAAKPGLYTLDGPDCSGEIQLDTLGLDFADSDGVVNGPELVAAQLGPRRRNTHKGSFGSAGIIGGAPGMAGAALLAGRAALRLGAGRVFVGLLERLAVDPLQPELMLRPATDVLPLATALAIGPGLGQMRTARELLRLAIAAPLPLVVDADALNLLAAHPTLQKALSRRSAPTLLTPHPAEAARLLHTDVAAIQSDRIGAALELAQRHHAKVALKGAGTVIAGVDGFWAVNATGNPGLASAGSGDVLTGMVVALLAQGWSARNALLGAVYLHGSAADDLVASGHGPAGLTAGELIDPARRRLNRLHADA